MLFSSLRIMLYDEIENTQSLNYDWGDYICHNDDWAWQLAIE